MPYGDKRMLKKVQIKIVLFFALIGILIIAGISLTYINSLKSINVIEGTEAQEAEDVSLGSRIVRKQRETEALKGV